MSEIGVGPKAGGVTSEDARERLAEPAAAAWTWTAAGVARGDAGFGDVVLTPRLPNGLVPMPAQPPIG